MREDAQRIAYVLVREGAAIDLKNNEGVVPLKYATPSFGVLLQMIASNPKLAAAVPTLDDAMDPALNLAGACHVREWFLLCNTAGIGVLGDKETKAFCGAAAIVMHEQAQCTASSHIISSIFSLTRAQ